MKKHRFIFSLRKNILMGLLFSGPILATLWILEVIWKFVWRATAGWIPRSWFPNLAEGGVWRLRLLDSLSLIALVIGLYVLGMLVSNLIGRGFLTWSDRAFSNIPVVRSIYLFFRQISGWIASRNNSVFRSVVLVEYPRKGSFALGFVTSDADIRIINKARDISATTDPFVSVFIPTTPNPMSGFLLFYASSEIIPLDMDVRDAFNLIISAGVINTETQQEDAGSNYLDRLHDALHSIKNNKE